MGWPEAEMGSQKVPTSVHVISCIPPPALSGPWNACHTKPGNLHVIAKTSRRPLSNGESDVSWFLGRSNGMSAVR